MEEARVNLASVTLGQEELARITLLQEELEEARVTLEYKNSPVEGNLVKAIFSRTAK